MDKYNIGIVTFPMHKSGNQPLSNLIDIVVLRSEKTTLITGNDGYTLFKSDSRLNVNGIDHKSGALLVSRILKYLYTQVRISYLMIQKSSEVDKWIFFFGGNGLLLPLLTAKLSKKSTALLLADAGAGLAEPGRQRRPHQRRGCAATGRCQSGSTPDHGRPTHSANT